jgi:hypothetical protein
MMYIVCWMNLTTGICGVQDGFLHEGNAHDLIKEKVATPDGYAYWIAYSGGVEPQ